MSRLLDPEAVGLDEPVQVPEPEAMATAREFARRGLAIGPSSGLNIAAARRLAERLGPGHHVGTILPDRMERYFSTALFDRRGLRSSYVRGATRGALAPAGPG